MDDAVFVNYKIDDRSYVSYIKREIHNLVTGIGFSPKKVGEVDIVISELTSNLIKFADEGELLYRLGNDDGGDFLEVFCLDNGKGIKDLSKMLLDGMSSSDTLGQGLGAIKRLSHSSSIYTLPGWGTVMHSRIYIDDTVERRQTTVETGVVQVCCPGETVCGDGFSTKKIGNGMQFLMGDGLGHGINAHEAALAAIKAFKSCREVSPTAVIRHIHENVKKTRGLVATVAYLDYTAKKWHMCGVGNISTVLFTGLYGKTHTPYNGIVGMNIPRTLTDTVLDLEKYQTLIMHSDGLRSRWNLANLPGILKHDPNVIAAALYKDNARFNDDMSVLAAKINI
ncbi:SpoIIE family protein phosphatase [Flavobacterium sp. MFBS3-15]|uniref:SpoIIE family protein phosphatase n=1 Tax=Flavobacterium sp. MFBS3-15 TaxID=2989816 RepID=UPI00223634A2|nr:SpoIIE family protein phosphatase [Flavobacterium sp. MFBS3-15]MCW4469404.1 SpoIIE family protein phosphatase [Flavobacterium sp. MFBS3-15]